MQAATVAKISYRKLRGRKLIVVPGFSNKLLRLIIALTPKALAGPIAERRLPTDQSEQ
jgi:short-subunit dehydrogenase